MHYNTIKTNWITLFHSIIWSEAEQHTQTRPSMNNKYCKLEFEMYARILYRYMIATYVAHRWWTPSNTFRKHIDLIYAFCIRCTFWCRCTFLILLFWLVDSKSVKILWKQFQSSQAPKKRQRTHIYYIHCKQKLLDSCWPTAFNWIEPNWTEHKMFTCSKSNYSRCVNVFVLKHQSVLGQKS